ncbi:tetratricopeptide repeat protein [Bacillus pumilus]|uniref:response regulator aspartate phosphatase n=1 Tax=Bacillus pumilus TaxID=1408 RepID=UPI00119E7ABD|nr:tetratricopeptide repeat protein [Bacillus pumilus]
MDNIIPYDLVATKLNYWYTAIKNRRIEQAESIKEEVVEELDRMEENPDVFLYYQLLEFRHYMMINEINVHDIKMLDDDYLSLRKVERHENLTGMLEFYFYFFMGMYEFRRNELSTAISAYRKAERKLDEVDDIIEKADFYYKMAHVYYAKKQTYFSLNYAERALKIYDKDEEYLEHSLRCRFIVGGNLIDDLRYDEALEIFLRVLDTAEKKSDFLIKGMAHINIGVCYDELEDYDNATFHLDKALDILENYKRIYLTKILFMLTRIHCKIGNLEQAKYFYFKGTKYSEIMNDEEYQQKFKVLTVLYFEGDENLIDQCFEYLTKKRLYADIEYLSNDVGQYYEKKGNFELSTFYYKMNIESRYHIRKEVRKNNEKEKDVIDYVYTVH